MNEVKKRMSELFKPIDQQIMMCDDADEILENFLHPAPAIERCMDRLMKLGLTRSAAVGAYHDFLLED